MRKTVILALALAVFMAIPVGASAQGWLGGLLPSGGQTGASCGAPCCPGGLKLDAGYLFGQRAVQFGETVGGDGALYILRDSRFRSPLEGVQVGATLQAPLKDDVGVTLRGTWLFPTNGRADEDIARTGDLRVSRDWSTKVQYYTLDGAVVYPFCAPFNFLAGFRFDSLFMDFTGPRTAGGIEWLPTDKTEVTLNSYIPYVGIGLNYGQSLRVSLIGTPIFWGDLQFRETVGGFSGGPDSFEYKANLKNTYFLEASVEYALSVGPGTAGVLAKWTYMHGAGTPTFRDRYANGGAPAIYQQEPAAIALVRQHVYLAATFTIPLTSPW
jgi:hypothetical protein